MNKLMKQLPAYYRNSVIMTAILSAQDNELERLSEKVSNAALQMTVSTATDAIKRYEADFGIVSNNSESLEVRRSRIIAKLRGLQTITKEAIIRIIQAYVVGKISVVENPSEYTIKVKFITEKGVPGTMAGIEKAISDVIPAHLKVEYVYTYRTWNDVDEFIDSWSEAAQYTWDGLATKEIIPNLYIDTETSKVYYRPDYDGNAVIIFDSDGKPYAHLYESESEL